MEDTVEISKAEYEELLNEVRFLNALRAAGVDNWDWYDVALDNYNEE